MKVLVVRHATAADKEEFARTGKSDDLRPLTPAGKREMREITRGLREVVPGIDILATSPLVRAVQTAEIVGDSYKRKLVSIESLRPEAPYEAFVTWARGHRGKQTIAVVGHEPHLSGLVSWLLASSSRSLLELKKGAGCLLQFEDSPGAGAAILLWSMAPKHLRVMGRR